ncbi:MAG: hypothetical protein DRK00_05940 [Thermoprotei archaeon]|nr:MAG: hypothetical protein DRK00_05940 [Thermoprotei archaeon]
MIAELTVISRGRGVYDLTSKVERLIRSVEAERGVVLLYSLDPLCRLITIEYDADLVNDLLMLIKGLKAKNPYVVASIFQPSLLLPFKEGLLLGAFQQVCLLDLNERGGERRVIAEVLA